MFGSLGLWPLEFTIHYGPNTQRVFPRHPRQSTGDVCDDTHYIPFPRASQQNPKSGWQGSQGFTDSVKLTAHSAFMAPIKLWMKLKPVSSRRQYKVCQVEALSTMRGAGDGSLEFYGAVPVCKLSPRAPQSDSQYMGFSKEPKWPESISLIDCQWNTCS